MKLTQIFKMAFKALSSNKMRSFLTMLGIIIGVFSVSLLVSFVQSARDEIQGEFSSLGGNLLLVNVHNVGNVNLTLDDLNHLVAEENGISGISPVVSSIGAAKSSTKSIDDATISGVSEQYIPIRSITIERGRNFLYSDMQYRTAMAVIGTAIADDLFGYRDVVGNTINVAGRDFTVIGVLEEEGSGRISGNDNAIFIPFTTGQRLLQKADITQFYVSSTSSEDIRQAKTVIDTLMLSRVREDDSYTLMDQSAVTEVMNTVTDILTGVLGGVGGISLLVGGIGIMNIMLVSVTERTREIGIRKAIGAKRKHILAQFLIEAVVISLTGGMIGLLLSLAGAVVAGNLMDMSVQITKGIAALAIGFSVFVGLVFGTYPAAKAAGLAPIDALRYE